MTAYWGFVFCIFVLYMAIGWRFGRKIKIIDAFEDLSPFGVISALALSIAFPLVFLVWLAHDDSDDLSLR